jgi:hypothetical protein
MGDWLTLLVLVPAILVPIAALIGFAACDNLWKLPHIKDAKPIIDKAEGINPITIHLEWHFAAAAEKFHFERTGPGGSVGFDVTGSPKDDTGLPFDTGLPPNTTFDYQVQAVFSNGDPSGFSATATATTKPLALAYSRPLSQSTSFLQGSTLIQRIEAPHLSATGTHVRITVQASELSDAWIDRVYISKVNTMGKAWDPVTDPTDPARLTAIYDSAIQNGPFFVPKGETKPLPITRYPIDLSEALLIAFDFTPGPASSAASAPEIPKSEATVYFLQGAAEAALPIRSANYTLVESPMTMTSFVHFITIIEAG